MPAGSDRTQQFSEMIRGYSQRMAEEQRARGDIMAKAREAQIAAEYMPVQALLSGFEGAKKGYDFASGVIESKEARAARRRQGEIEEQKLAMQLRAEEQLAADRQRKADEAAKIAAFKAGEYKPGMTIGEAEQIIPLQVREKEAETSRMRALAEARQREASMVAEAPKAKPISPADIGRYGEGRDAVNMLETLGGVLSQADDVTGPVAGRVASMNPYNTKAMIVQSQIKSAAQLIGKYMEGGVLRKEDVPKYEAMLPNMHDTQEVAQGKLENVRDMLLMKNQADIGALESQGYDVSGLAATTRKTVPEETQPGGTSYASGIEPDVAAYAKKHGISYEEAAAVKRLKTGGK